jgi:rhamnosyltransferase
VPDTLVVLSTFNGERFLADQLESLRRSTFKDWTLFVRDDGSTDRTLTVVERFVAADSRIRTLATNDGRLGPAQSYGRLLAEAVETGAKYVFLCDQDDVWLTEKMGRQIEQVNAAERRFGPETPLLLHTDLAVVDEGLRLIHSSFLASQRLRHQARRPLETLAVQNFATGCTMLVNRALLEIALPIPEMAVMHDWWLALCAGGTGRILFDPQPTVLYRQHEANTIGARSYWSNLWDMLTRRRRRDGWKPSTIPHELAAVLKQAEAAAERLADFAPLSAKLLAEFVDLWRRPSLPGARLAKMRRLKTKRLDPLRQLLLQTRLYFAKPESVQR